LKNLFTMACEDKVIDIKRKSKLSVTAVCAFHGFVKQTRLELLLSPTSFGCKPVSDLLVPEFGRDVETI
jgi:hypothetical protein